MARFHRETKKKQFEIFAKIAQISLPWQQIQNLRTTFCSFCHGELMAKKWFDSIEKQKEQESPAVADKPARRLKSGSLVIQGQRK